MRHPAFAGSFYPEDEAVLRQLVDDYLASAVLPADAGSHRLRAVVVPHAGYSYSGPIAGSAYALARKLGASFQDVLLLGPAHRVAIDGWALGQADFLGTPLGPIAVSGRLQAAAEQVNGGSTQERALAVEHSLEVQLPFLKLALPHCPVLPVLVGHASSSRVAQLLAKVVTLPTTLIVVSSDLSHYEPDAVARGLDEETARRIERIEPPIAPDRACGAFPLNGLLEHARRSHWRGQRLDLRNSGDTAGDQSRVVGYGAFAFWEAA